MIKFSAEVFYDFSSYKTFLIFLFSFSECSSGVLGISIPCWVLLTLGWRYQASEDRVFNVRSDRLNFDQSPYNRQAKHISGQKTCCHFRNINKCRKATIILERKIHSNVLFLNYEFILLLLRLNGI